MLRGLFDCVIVHSLFLKNTDAKTLKLRQLLMKQLRDADFHVRYLATEGFCRMLMCESTDKGRDFLARLMLLQFEKSSLRNDSKGNVKGKDDNDCGQARICIDQFMQGFVRLSKDRCTEVYISTVFVVYYLLCAKGGKVSCDPCFMNINLFYLFGTMADLLKYDYNREFGIFDMLEQKHPISYQLLLFEFFCFFALNHPED